MSDEPSVLLDRLDLERLDRDLFRGYSPDDQGRPQVFGGQVAAQALVAAGRTVEERLVHSLHSYFLRPGDPKTPIIYEVDRIRDGRSFTTRRVVAIQNGKAIFNMSASFQVAETGYEHHAPMPLNVPPPQSVPSNQERIRAAAKTSKHPFFAILDRFERPIVMHDLEPLDPLAPEQRTSPHRVWFKSRAALPDDPVLHRCVLTYASDMTLLGASLGQHALTWFDRTLKVASLDHAIWFHHDCRADEWLLYVTESPSTSGGRGMNFGRIYTEAGLLVASTSQENLMRRRA